MNTYVFLFLLATILPMLASCQQPKNRHAKGVPADFRLEALAGGLHPWEENQFVAITADGKGHFARTIPGKTGAPPEQEQDFAVSAPQLETLWSLIDSSGFFNLEAEYKDDAVTGGWFASLTVTAAGKTHRVTVQNVAQPHIIAILREINKLTPDNMDLTMPGDRR